MRPRLAWLVAALCLVAAAPAAAHVEVLPAEVERGGAVQFTVRVPTERDVPTTRVRVDIPEQVTVFSFAEPPRGWTMKPVRGADGRFRSVVYTGSVGVDRYVDFQMLGTPFETGTAVWPARQMYGDGQEKPWTGPPEVPGEAQAESGPTDPGPAAAVSVVEPGEATAGASGASGASGRGGDGDEGSGAAIWLGVIAIGISGLSLLALGFLWSTRPARLPEEDASR